MTAALFLVCACRLFSEKHVIQKNILFETSQFLDLREAVLINSENADKGF